MATEHHQNHREMMQLALAEAVKARDAGEVPIGAVIARGSTLLARGFNGPIGSRDPTAHAEVVAIRHACLEERNYRLSGATLYVTVEPCLMCVGAAIHARVESLVYGATEPKFGAVSSLLRLDTLKLSHRMEVVSGVLEPECRDILVEFFRSRR